MTTSTHPVNPSKHRLQLTQAGQPVNLLDVIKAVAAGDDPALYRGTLEPANSDRGETDPGQENFQVRDAFALNSRRLR